MMPMFVVTKQDGTVIPLKDPKTATPGIQDLDSGEAGRNQQGRNFRYRVAIKHKWTCAWGPLTPAQLSVLLSAVEDESFWLTYTDPKTNTERTAEFYVGDRTMPVLWWNAAKGKRMYAGLNMNFIEM